MCLAHARQTRAPRGGWSTRWPHRRLRHEQVAILMAGEQAILQRRLRLQLAHQEQGDHHQRQGEREPGQAARLPVGVTLLLLLGPAVLVQSWAWRIGCITASRLPVSVAPRRLAFKLRAASSAASMPRVTTPRAAAHLAACDPDLAALIRRVGPCGMRQDRSSPYEALVRAIAHQQLHGAAARAITARFLALFPSGAFPRPEWLLAADPASCAPAVLGREDRDHPRHRGRGVRAWCRRGARRSPVGRGADRAIGACADRALDRGDAAHVQSRPPGRAAGR